MSGPRDVSRRLTLPAACYVAAVGLCAAWGFAVGSPWPVVLAAAAAVPASLVAAPLYYVMYGLLALVPGANPSSSAGSGSSSAAGGTDSSYVTGEPAAWFTVTTHTLGVVTLMLAATTDVLLVRALVARHRTGSARLGGGPPGQPV